MNPDEAICRFETVSHSTTKKRLLRSDRADRPPFKKVKFLVPEQFFCGISNVTPYVLNSNSVYQPAMLVIMYLLIFLHRFFDLNLLISCY